MVPISVIRASGVKRLAPLSSFPSVSCRFSELAFPMLTFPGCRRPTCKGVEILLPEVFMASRYQNRIELLQGTLDLLILQTLQWGPRHGYGISQAIRLNSDEALQVDTGSLYPALHRLERQRWIKARWKVSENKQRVRVYHLT